MSEKGVTSMRLAVSTLAAAHTCGQKLEDALRAQFPDATTVRADVVPIIGTRRIVNVTINGPDGLYGETFQFP